MVKFKCTNIHSTLNTVARRDFMSAITVDIRDRKPIWEQLTDNIKDLILRGDLAPGEQIPAVRSLASELTVNPNTIQKAYTELERQGIIYSVKGRGSFVSDNVESIRSAKRAQLLSELEKTLLGLKSSGLSKADIYSAAEKIWGGENDD